MTIRRIQLTSSNIRFHLRNYWRNKCCYLLNTEYNQYGENEKITTYVMPIITTIIIIFRSAWQCIGNLNTSFELAYFFSEKRAGWSNEMYRDIHLFNLMRFTYKSLFKIVVENYSTGWISAWHVLIKSLHLTCIHSPLL